MKYHFFLDESGDHGLSYVDKNFPLFLLCGCLFRDDVLKRVEEKINDFKFKYFQTKEVILHSRDIRKCEGAFQILFDLKLKEEFYRDLNAIIEDADFIIIGAGIDKEKHIKKYGKGAKNPYSLSLSFLIERLIFCLDNLDKKAVVDIKAELRGKREDKMLLAHYNSILDRGTYYVSTSRLKEKIIDFKFFVNGKTLLAYKLQI